MRISDWSSDVCSSDLLADAHQVARPLARQRRHRHVEHLEHRLLALADGEPADCVAIEADVGQRLRRTPSELRIDAALHDAEEAIARPFGEGRLRSEEHTSELQSLMRISYAVFCLKKKK